MKKLTKRVQAGGLWFDQADGEAAERREWMARGASMVRDHHRKTRELSCVDEKIVRHGWASFIANVIVNKIRAGEVE